MYDSTPKLPLEKVGNNKLGLNSARNDRRRTLFLVWISPLICEDGHAETKSHLNQGERFGITPGAEQRLVEPLVFVGSLSSLSSRGAAVSRSRRVRAICQDIRR